ncbi:MGH1-like glycoside hydrolase domain-containing protein [Adhaeribacter rhizoryzae]|uniref:Glycoside hydrolase n=1 Tax=Adhaeribacter rhizoryzae TaxID=2607907 RepID=A0A5M6D8Y5_9BACT|nr:trehalase family glycosidase [Adhaeribacter rhizoryzae]KAA5542940.1 glycoside hydrolase [Adhaeribacter rhizoryzae]
MRKTFWCIGLLLFFYSGVSGQNQPKIDYKQLINLHDIPQLASWGPYAKKYAGISHIPHLEKGLRFDFSVMPGYYRNKVLIPNVRFESGYFPWQVNPEMTSLTYRYELEWKDQVFVDVTYTVLDTSQVLVKLRSVNNTNLPQNLALHLMGYLAYPDVYPALQVNNTTEATWQNAVNYKSLTFAKPRPSDNLVYDGWLRGEARNNNYIDGSAVAQNFGRDKGDKVEYEVTIPKQNLKGQLAIRYRLPEEKKFGFNLNGFINQIIELTGTGNFECLKIPYAVNKAGKYRLTLTSEGGNGVELNGFFISSPGYTVEQNIIPQPKEFQPELTQGNSASELILKYPDLNNYYGIAWDFSPSQVRELLNDELDIFFKEQVHNHVSARIMGNNQGHYTDVFLRPVALAANSELTTYGLICTGSQNQVKNLLAAFKAKNQAQIQSLANNKTTEPKILPEGEPFRFSQQLMQAATLNNVVYPVYTQGNYIRHFTPGKWWNSLYTWDSGFLGLGLSTIDLPKAISNLNAYTTPVGSQSAFIHHGSPVPVQMYLFQELWNKTQSRELLAYFYPRLKQYYNFLAGKSGSSTTRNLQSGLLRTWDYFYNSGGWDDYPPQAGVHAQKLESSVTPVVTTAHCLRTAKILRQAALALGLKNEAKAFDKDIAAFTNSLQQYSWDEQAGYFSYVVHDAAGKPSGFFKHSQSGLNYNMGLDGAYPLFSGICTPAQQEILLEKMFSPKHLWTPAGMSVVDQSAPYYRIDGYWNGSVWMPHQWFMWKTMLDLGRADLAYKIAQKGLEVWKKETDASYYTFEHFLAQSGRGAGWHQFSGLSTPVLSWFDAYYKPGTVTTGLEIWLTKKAFNPNQTIFNASLEFDTATPAHTRSLLVCMNPEATYEVLFNGKSIAITSPYKGLLQINLPATNQPGKLVIQPVKNKG